MFRQIKRNVFPKAKSALSRVGNSALQAAKAAAMHEIRSAAGTVGTGFYRRKRRKLNRYKGSGLYTGRGAYSNAGAIPTANTLVKGGRPSFKMASSNDETQSIVFSHVEFIQDIFGSSTPEKFTVLSFDLNPALMENFPFLAQLAMNFEEYEFIQLLFHFKATVDPSASNNSSGATGTVILATNYNPTALAFSNKEVMMQYHGANSGRLTDDHVHGVECDPKKNAGSKTKYTRALPVVVNEDKKTYDLGKFQLAMVNLPSAFKDAQVGELWVEYTVKLSKPRIFTALSGGMPEYRVAGKYDGQCLGSGTGNYTGVPAEFFGNTIDDKNVPNLAFYMQQNQLGISLTQGSGYSNTNAFFAGSYRFTFPASYTGLVEIQWAVELSQFTAPAGTISNTYTGNVTQWKDYLASNSSSGDTPGSYYFALGNNVFIYTTKWSIQAATGNTNQTIQFNWNGWTMTYSAVSVVIRQINPNLSQSSTNNLPVYVDSNNNVVTFN